MDPPSKIAIAYFIKPLQSIEENVCAHVLSTLFLEFPMGFEMYVIFLRSINSLLTLCFRVRYHNFLIVVTLESFRFYSYSMFNGNKSFRCTTDLTLEQKMNIGDIFGISVRYNGC